MCVAWVRSHGLHRLAASIICRVLWRSRQTTEVYGLIRPFCGVDIPTLLSLFEGDEVQGRAERFAPLL